jgi:gamma-glutamylcysteine synthetase
MLKLVGVVDATIANTSLAGGKSRAYIDWRQDLWKFRVRAGEGLDEGESGAAPDAEC